jgi:hypothetical protein
VAVDDQALDRRVKGEAFTAIAKALGLDGSLDANRAFNRALRRRPPPEQATIRKQEGHRLDRMAKAVEANEALSAEQAAKRLHTIEQLRARLAAE